MRADTRISAFDSLSRFCMIEENEKKRKKRSKKERKREEKIKERKTTIGERRETENYDFS